MNRIYGSGDDLRTLAEEEISYIQENGFAKYEDNRLKEQGLIILYETLRDENSQRDLIHTRYWN